LVFVYDGEATPVIFVGSLDYPDDWPLAQKQWWGHAYVAEIAAALLGFVATFLALSKADGRFAESDRIFIQAPVLGSSLP
jgi:hypothetical protein